jgi:hypothetical protein
MKKLIIVVLTSHYKEQQSYEMWWVKFVACMGKMKSVYIVLLGKPKEENHLGDLYLI